MPISAILKELNIPAVLVAGFAHMVVGIVWFMPFLFGNTWATLTGRDLKPPLQWLPIGLLGHILIAFGIAVVLRLAGDSSILGTLAIGGLVWLCFVVTLELGEVIWEKIPLKLFLIRIGNHLVSIAVVCLILALWK